MIGFVGSVFSPWYRWSGRRNPADHACINVATYGSGGRFTMTDRGEAALRRTPDRLEVGPSRMTWTGDRLVIEVDEYAAPPIPGRVRGRIDIIPSALTSVEVELTPDGRHRWRPFAPVARIEVALNRGWEWQGHGYFDANWGTAALEADFRTWTWGRFPHRGGTACFYDAVRRNGEAMSVALRFAPDGSFEAFDAPPPARLSRSLWALSRATRADPGYRPAQVRGLLDAPFYCRSLVRTRIGGEETLGVHEALDLTRFAWPWLKPMIALRVPRRRGWAFAGPPQPGSNP